jgi:hypothetical protein
MRGLLVYHKQLIIFLKVDLKWLKMVEIYLKFLIHYQTRQKGSKANWFILKLL